jgi:hypothetical protein
LWIADKPSSFREGHRKTPYNEGMRPIRSGYIPELESKLRIGAALAMPLVVVSGIVLIARHSQGLGWLLIVGGALSSVVMGLQIRKGSG